MSAPVPAGPTDAQAELREEIARAIFAAAHPIVEAFPDYWKRVAGGESTRERYRCQADAVLALHTVRDALAAQEELAKLKRHRARVLVERDKAQETVRRVEALLPEIEAMEQRDSGEEIACMIRRALAGDQ